MLSWRASIVRVVTSSSDFTSSLFGFGCFGKIFEATFEPTWRNNFLPVDGNKSLCCLSRVVTADKKLKLCLLKNLFLLILRWWKKSTSIYDLEKLACYWGAHHASQTKHWLHRARRRAEETSKFWKNFDVALLPSELIIFSCRAVGWAGWFGGGKKTEVLLSISHHNCKRTVYYIRDWKRKMGSDPNKVVTTQLHVCFFLPQRSGERRRWSTWLQQKHNNQMESYDLYVVRKKR